MFDVLIIINMIILGIILTIVSAIHSGDGK